MAARGLSVLPLKPRSWLVFTPHRPSGTLFPRSPSGLEPPPAPTHEPRATTARYLSNNVATDAVERADTRSRCGRTRTRRTPQISRFHQNELAVDAGQVRPAVDVTLVVADLEMVDVLGRDEVEKHSTVHLAQDDVTLVDDVVLRRLYRHELTRFDLRRHAVPVWPELDRLTLFQAFYKRIESHRISQLRSFDVNHLT